MNRKLVILRLLLLDACVVIECYEVKVWERLVTKSEIVIPSTVINEAQYFRSSNIQSIPQSIDLQRLVGEEIIKEASATIQEIAKLKGCFDCAFINDIDPGEIEALALLQIKYCNTHKFCTGDGNAIKAAAMLGLSSSIISLEEILNSLGLTKKLKKEYRKEFCKRHLKIGNQNLITGFGLSKKSK